MMNDGGYEAGHVTRESELLSTGSDEQDDFDPALEEWAGVTSENLGDEDPDAI